MRLYNDRFNSIIPRRYDGSHLDFPGLNPLITLRQIQKDVIWRGLQSQSLLMAHQVGFGKTFSQIGLTMRLKQMRLRQRLMIVVKRATFGQFVAAFREAYPLANISTDRQRADTPAAPEAARPDRYRRLRGDHHHPPDPEQNPAQAGNQAALSARAGGRDRGRRILEVKGDRISTKELEKAKKRLEDQDQAGDGKRHGA